MLVELIQLLLIADFNMKISELKVGQGKVDVEGTIQNVGDVRVFNKYGRDLKVANATLVTAEGESITLSLWNEDITRIKNGDKVKVVNGYVSEFNGTKQLSSGKFGKIEVVGAPDSGKAKKEEITEQEF